MQFGKVLHLTYSLKQIYESGSSQALATRKVQA